MKYFPIVWASLGRKKIRTILTLLSISVAFILFGYLAAIEETLGQGVSIAGADRLIVRHKVSLIQLLPVSYYPRIDQIDGVELVGHLTSFGGVIRSCVVFLLRLRSDETIF